MGLPLRWWQLKCATSDPLKIPTLGTDAYKTGHAIYRIRNKKATKPWLLRMLECQNQTHADLKWNHMAIAEEGGLGPNLKLDEGVKTEEDHLNI